MYLSITGSTLDNKLAKYQPFEAEADAVTHALVYNGFAIEDPGGNQEFWVVNMTDKTVVIDTDTEASVTAARTMSDIREKRDNLLAATDWWGASDQTMTDAQTAYRAALRDVPAQADLNNITWPEKP